MVEWKYIKPIPDKNVVKQFLEKNNIVLPRYLVQIITEFNGGRPSKKDFKTSDGREYVFKSLLSYNKADKENIYGIYPELFINTTLYPIGSDAAGSFVCFDTKSKELKLLNHETGKAEIISSFPF